MENQAPITRAVVEDCYVILRRVASIPNYTGVSDEGSQPAVLDPSELSEYRTYSLLEARRLYRAGCPGGYEVHLFLIDGDDVTTARSTRGGLDATTRWFEDEVHALVNMANLANLSSTSTTALVSVRHDSSLHPVSSTPVLPAPGAPMTAPDMHIWSMGAPAECEHPADATTLPDHYDYMVIQRTALVPSEDGPALGSDGGQKRMPKLTEVLARPRFAAVEMRCYPRLPDSRSHCVVWYSHDDRGVRYRTTEMMSQHNALFVMRCTRERWLRFSDTAVVPVSTDIKYDRVPAAPGEQAVKKTLDKHLDEAREILGVSPVTRVDMTLNDAITYLQRLRQERGGGSHVVQFTGQDGITFILKKK